MIEFELNGKGVRVAVEDDTPLLWALRDTLKLHGTKDGCGMGLCGACTVHVAGAPVRSCQTPISAVQGKSVTTIEGIGVATKTAAADDASGTGLHPVQQAWIEGNVPQCGYCQSGQIMAAVALLEHNPAPTDADIDTAMSGNLCRCGMYNRIRAAIHRAAQLQSAGGGTSTVHLFDPAGLLVRSFT